MALDNITLLVITGLGHACLALLLLFFRKPVDHLVAIRWFAASQISFAIGLILIIGRRSGSLFWFSTIPNTLVTLGMALLSVALASFFRWRVERQLFAIGLPLTIAQLFLRDLGFAEHFRLAWAVIIASAMQFVITLLYAQRWREASPLTRFLATANFLISLLLLIRFVEALLAGADYGFFNAGWGQLLGLLAIFANALINGFGFLLLLNEQSNRELQRYVTLDNLTAVLNRRTWLIQAQKELVLADRHDKALSLLFLELDHLHELNLRFNVYLGDERLKQLVVAVRTQLRHHDLIGRWTGKVFIVLLANTDLVAAQALAQQIQTQFSHGNFTGEAGDIACSVTIGVAQYRRHEDFQLTLNRGETALHHAREIAHGQIHCLD